MPPSCYRQNCVIHNFPCHQQFAFCIFSTMHLELTENTLSKFDLPWDKKQTTLITLDKYEHESSSFINFIQKLSILACML